MDTIGFKETYIYCLIHNDEVRYVGKSDNPNQRFKDHLRKSKYKKTDVCQVLYKYFYGIK